MFIKEISGKNAFDRITTHKVYKMCSTANLSLFRTSNTTTPKIMKCECSCGGKNHGRGNFMCEAA